MPPVFVFSPHVLLFLFTGCSVGLMGPSGSGKSSLLDILSGHEKSGKVQGVVEYFSHSHRINARQDVEGLRVRVAHTTVEGIGYVYQDDQLLPSQTVLEALTFSAEVRLPRDISRGTVKARVQSTLMLLDLLHIAGPLLPSLMFLQVWISHAHVCDLCCFDRLQDRVPGCWRGHLGWRTEAGQHRYGIGGTAKIVAVGRTDNRPGQCEVGSQQAPKNKKTVFSASS